MSKVVKSVGSALGFGGESSVKSAGKSQERGVKRQIDYLRGAEQRATERMAPFVSLGTDNISNYQNLLDPSQRFASVMSNPLVSGALDEIGRQTGLEQAAGGKFNSGGTLNALFNRNFNLLNSLGQQELSNALTPVQLGQSAAAGSAANTLSSGTQVGNAYSNIGDIQASTILGRQNASAALGNNLLQMGGGALYGSGLLGAGTGVAGGGLGGAGLGALLFSDRRVKTNVVEVDKDELGGIYEFDYIWGGPRMRGRMADELRQSRPDAVQEVDGYLMVTQEFAPEEVNG